MPFLLRLLSWLVSIVNMRVTQSQVKHCEASGERGPTNLLLIQYTRRQWSKMPKKLMGSGLILDDRRRTYLTKPFVRGAFTQANIRREPSLSRFSNTMYI